MRTRLPAVLLLDLDDTIVSLDQHNTPAWREICRVMGSRCGGDELSMFDEIQRVSNHYWSDPERHRQGRLSLDRTRRDLVRLAFGNLGLTAALADEAAAAFTALKDARLCLFAGAIETLAQLARHCRLALVTNGESHKQRAKIDRFGLAPFFEAIFVEEEVGVGKPDPRVYRHALEVMGAEASACWMVGDNLEWDVAAPQTLGIFSVWNDWRGRGLPPDAKVRPDRTIRSIAELLLGQEEEHDGRAHP